MSFNKILGQLGGTAQGAAIDTLIAAGRSSIHAMAPDDFEYYMCSLELLDSEGVTKGFMMFPVMPNNIMETKTEILSTIKTNSGIVSVFNPTFVPREISIQGTFGRKLRMISNFVEVEEAPSNWFRNVVGGSYGKLTGSKTIFKTGYGMMRAMKKMVDTLYKLDENGRPHIMIFNNYAFNSHYVVEIPQSSFSQSTGENMIWYYNLEMRAIANASVAKEQTIKNIFNLAVNSAIANGIGDILSETRHLIDVGVVGYI